MNIAKFPLMPDHDAEQAVYRVSLTIAVSSEDELWRAAAERGLRGPYATMADIIDVIGPREDPSMENCIAMLAAPPAMAGCRLDDFWIDALPDASIARAGLPAKH